MERIGQIRSDAYLKTLFEKGDKPNENDFADLIESKAHKQEVIFKKDVATNEDIDEIITSIDSPSDENDSESTVVKKHIHQTNFVKATLI